VAKMRKDIKTGQVIVLVLLCAVFLALVGALVVRQRIFDYLKLRDYHASPAIAQLVSQDTMNGYTQHVFYVNQPQLLDTVASFRADCPEDTADIVLGCYHSGQNGIFIYNVPDKSLYGVTQVTAAHEVLHALYARLPSAQRITLDNELESYYKHGLTDSRVKAEVALYIKTEPGSVYDEMSCTFGTEIASLPTGLNNYYKQFFRDRAKIVGFEQQYQGLLTSREQQVSSDDAQLASLKAALMKQDQLINSESSDIDNRRTALQGLQASNPTQ
jgi:hypothetical protein